MRLFGLIGCPLGHSFSKKYFSEKFRSESITDARYELFELKTVSEITRIFDKPGLRGLNVTIPYKEQVQPFLDKLDGSAVKIGAVNVIRIEDDGKKTGYNSDYYGFLYALKGWIPDTTGLKALVLGTGGSSHAVCAVLEDLQIDFQMVSRSADKGITYDQLKQDRKHIKEHRLIINATPLGMSPNTASCPDLPFDWLTAKHRLFDLVYNPEETTFMKRGEKSGALSKNGYEMLVLQAEKSWEIWNS